MLYHTFLKEKRMNRKEAAENGLIKYSTGVSCKHGHAPQRYTVSGICVECSKIATTRTNKNLRSKLKIKKLNEIAGIKTLNITIPARDVELFNAFVFALNLQYEVDVLTEMEHVNRQFALK